MDVSFLGTLNGHDGAVTCIKASSEFSVIVSGSVDRSCIVYDSNRVRFVRSLGGHNGPIVALDIHPYLVFFLFFDIQPYLVVFLFFSFSMHFSYYFY